MRFGRSTPGRLVAVVAFTAATTLGLSTPALASGAAPEQGLQQSAPRAVATAPPVAPPTLPAPPKTAPNKPGNPAVATPTPTGVGPQVSTPVITCSANVQNPHNSSHVNGTVNVVVTLLCTATVPQINIRAALYRNGVLVKDSGQRTINNNVGNWSGPQDRLTESQAVSGSQGRPSARVVRASKKWTPCLAAVAR
jgi:hypothetical protein